MRAQGGRIQIGVNISIAMRLVSPLPVLVCLMTGCGKQPSSKAKLEPSTVVSRSCPGAKLDQELLRFLETTQNSVSGMVVGTANIFTTDFPDATGKVISQLTAQVFVSEPTAKWGDEHTVTAGIVINVGADRYCIVEIGSRGEGHPTGWLLLRKVIP